MGILIAVFSIAVIVDLHSYRIPNLCVLAGALAGMVMMYMSYSFEGILVACVSMLFIFMVFYPFYLIGGLGAGDIKLFMMTGCFISQKQMIIYLLVTFVIAAIAAAVKLLMYHESRQRLVYLGRYLKKLMLTGQPENYNTDKGNAHCVVRLSVPAFISLLMMYAGIY